MSLTLRGKADEARKVAIAATTNVKPLPADEMNPLAGNATHDDVILWLAYKEAKALIGFEGDAKTPSPQQAPPPREKK